MHKNKSHPINDDACLNEGIENLDMRDIAPLTQTERQMIAPRIAALGRSFGDSASNQ